MLSITIDKKSIVNINKFIQRYPNLVDKALNVTSSYGKKKVIKDTPVKTGQARRNYFNKRTGKLEYTIDNRKKYPEYLETGTGIHGPRKRKIKPKRAKYLHFPIVEANTVLAWIRTKSTKGMKAVKQYSSNIPAITKKLTSTLELYIREAWGRI